MHIYLISLCDRFSIKIRIAYAFYKCTGVRSFYTGQLLALRRGVFIVYYALEIVKLYHRQNIIAARTSFRDQNNYVHGELFGIGLNKIFSKQIVAS